MPKTLLPTIEPAGAQGGIARYLQAIVATFPNDVELIQVEPSYFSIFKNVFLPKPPMVWVNHLLPIGTVAWLWSLITKQSYTIFLHGLDFDLARRNNWKQWLTKHILGGAKHIVTNTTALGREIHDFAPTSVTPLTVYPVVSDVLLLAARQPTTENRQPRAFTLLTVSRLVARKGHIKVLDALLELPEARYVIVGDGPERGVIEQAIVERHLNDRVTLITQANDEQLIEAYRSADIFVMPTTKTPTDREGFGIVYAEAQLFGLPVVATNHPGVDEAIIDGTTGLLIEDSPLALVTALKKLVEDPALREQLGSNGPAWVRKNFTREIQMQKLTTCFS